MYKYLFLLLIIPLISFYTQGCDTNLLAEDGSGKITKVTVNSNTSFNKIENESSANVFYTQSTQTSVEVEIDDNLQNHVETVIKDGKLIIDVHESINPTKFNVYISSPSLVGYEIDGSGDFFANGNIETPLMSININGSGDVSFSSLATENLLYNVNGSGDGNLKVTSLVNQLDINVNGSGNLRLNRIDLERAVININGSGDVSASGIADGVRINVAGSGKTKFRDLKTRTSEISINGSGDVSIFVIEKLIANINGSGDIELGGNPEIYVQKYGSGDINRI